MFKVFESGSGKWVRVVDGEVRYYSDNSFATEFDDRSLCEAYGFFGDFSIYKKTMHAVPIGENQYPWKCKTVKSQVKEIKHEIEGEVNAIHP